MGEYANLQIRADMKRLFGYDPGEIEDEPRRFKKPVYERVQCPHCKAKPKKAGLKDHIKAMHSAHCMCNACKDGVLHASDCAVHSMPAYPNGPCDCGAIAKGTA